MIVEGWPDDPDTPRRLRGLAAVGDNLLGYFGDTVLLLLVEGWPTEQESVEPIAAELRPLDYLRREQVFKALLTSLGSNPNRLPWVRNLAQFDPSDIVRRDALITFTRHSSDKAGAHELLRERASNDPSPSVRQQALRLLTHTDTNKPAVIEFLRNHMTNDPDATVRGTALHLIEIHLDAHATYDLLIRTDRPELKLPSGQHPRLNQARIPRSPALASPLHLL